MNFNIIFWVIRAFIIRIVTLNSSKFKYIGKTINVIGLQRISTCEEVGLFPGARIEILAGSLVIGKGSRIGHNFFCESSGGAIKIGKNVTISANCFIGATDYLWREEQSLPFRSKTHVHRDVVIGDNVFIGFGSCILPGAVILDNSIIGANCVVKGGSVISGIYTGNK